MINFPKSFPEERLLKKAVRWSRRNGFHIPSLTELAGRRSSAELTEIGRNWQDAGLGLMIEASEEGKRSVHFALNDEAVMAVNRLNQQTIFGRIRSVNRSDWIAIGALIVSVIALFRPGS